MTLHPKNHWQIPEQTAQIARASFPKGNEFMKIYDELGTLYTDTDFASLFPVRSGQSAISPAKLALIVESSLLHQVSVMGPVALDNSWQAKLKTGFDVSAFVIDWDKEVVKCPQGNLSRLWQKLVTAINLSRFFAWSKQVNKAQTRTSLFARLRVC